MTTTQRAITVDLAYLTALIECAFFVHMGRSRAGGPDIRDRELAFGVGTAAGIGSAMWGEEIPCPSCMPTIAQRSAAPHPI
jgi:hypothetical protein